MAVETCPVVRVKFENEQGFIIVNETDFDKDTQALFEEAPAVAVVEPVKEETAPPEEPPAPWAPA